MGRKVLSATLLVSLPLVACPAALVAQLTVERTIFVSATGTPEENCATLRSVLGSIPSPRVISNAYLVNVGPGDYDCGTNIVSIPSYVEVVGAGQVTVIRGSVNSPIFGVVDFDDVIGSSLRSLKVKNSGIPDSIAVTVYQSFDIELRDVELSPRQSGATISTGLLAYSDSLLGSDFCQVEVWNSQLFGFKGATTRQAVSGASVRITFYSAYFGAQTDTSAGGEVKCASSTWALSPLDSDCLLL